MSPWRVAPRRSASASRSCVPEGVGIAIVDAVSNDDLVRLGPVLARMPLVTAGSGVAIGLPAQLRLRSVVDRERAAGPRWRSIPFASRPAFAGAESSVSCRGP